MKRLLSLLLLTLMIVSVIPVSALADCNTNGQSKVYGTPTETEIHDPGMQVMTIAPTGRITNPNITFTYSPPIMTNAAPIIFTDSTTGMPAYCLDNNRGVPSPDSLDGENDFNPETIFDPETYIGVKCLLLAGYPYEIPDGMTAAEAQGCTQLALWCWISESTGNGVTANNYTPLEGKEYIYDYFQSLIETARQQSYPTLELSATNIVMVKDGDVLTGQTTVSYTNLNGGYSLDESKWPDDIIVTGYTGADGDILTITVPLSFAGVNLVLSDTLSGHDERSDLNLFWYDNTNPSQQRMAISVTDTSKVAITADISMAFQGYGSVKLTKISSTDNMPLNNAVFGVYTTESDEKIAELKTDENGEATFVLTVGEYYLVEITAPDGYVKSEDRINFSITNNKITEVSVVNSKAAGYVKIFKTSSNTNNLLAGVVFGIYKDGVSICELTTGADGTVMSPALEIGNYELREMSTVAGYKLLDSPIPFRITENDAIVELHIENEEIVGSFKIIKKDDSGRLLGGAIFGIYDASNDFKFAEVTTTENGIAIYDNLPYGSYYLKELTAPEGYLLSSERTPFELKIQGETIELTVINTKEPISMGKIKLIKKDADTEEVLANAVFGVYTSDTDEKVCELKTDANGIAVSPELIIGDYYFQELSAPSGYELSSDKVSVTVKENEIIQITVTNKAIPIPTAVGKIKITKKDSDTSKLLQGAIFGLYNSANDEKVCELSTNANGIAISSDLPTGNYYLKELFAPVGYELSTEKITATIEDGKTIEISITNKLLLITPSVGKVKVIKKDGDTLKLLPNAVFGLYNSTEDTQICELKTDENGTAVTNDLPVGNYYLKEINAPDGYIADGDKISVYIKSNEITDIIVLNYPAPKTAEPAPMGGRIKLIKVDDKTDKRLSGAVFGVYDASNDFKVFEMTTDINGEAVSSLLSIGDYYVRELKAPDGYEISSERFGFNIQENTVAEIIIENPKKPEPTVPTAKPSQNLATPATATNR